MFTFHESKKFNELHEKIKKIALEKSRKPQHKIVTRSLNNVEYLSKQQNTIKVKISINQTGNVVKFVKLGEEFENLFKFRESVKLGNRISTPTLVEKTFEIKRMEFNQKKEIKPEFSEEYLRKVYTLLKTNDKEFVK